MTSKMINCEKPSVVCRYLHRLWWTKHGTVKRCMSCGACWDERERPGQDRGGVPELRLQDEKDTTLIGLPAILEGTDQCRINYGGQIIRVTVLENLGPMVKCRWIKEGRDSVLCVHRDTVIEQDRDRIMRLGGSERQLVWESDGKELE